MAWEAMPYPVEADEYPVREGYKIEGGFIATIEQFYENAPYYANAITPQGASERSGPMRDYAAAKAWAERTAGVRP